MRRWAVLGRFNPPGVLSRASRAKAASQDVKNAVSTLMGSNPNVWMQAVRSASDAYVDELSGAWDDPMRPFVSGFLFPRKVSAVVEAELTRGRRSC